MLYPKKVKFRKWFTKRLHPTKMKASETRGTTLAFGSYGLKAVTYSRVTSNEIEAARKALSRYASKSGKVWIRVFPDRPFTQKPAEVKMGKGKGEPVGFMCEVRPGRILFEIDGVDKVTATKAFRQASARLSVKTKTVSRIA